MPSCYRSAHAAVARPVHLGHLAGDDISLETPATNPGCGPFSQDDIMTRWYRDLEATLAIRRERLDGRVAGFDYELRVTNRRNTRLLTFPDRSGTARRDDNRAFNPARPGDRCFCHGCHADERD